VENIEDIVATLGVETRRVAVRSTVWLGLRVASLKPLANGSIYLGRRGELVVEEMLR
jgi:hypothetical protein